MRREAQALLAIAILASAGGCGSNQARIAEPDPLPDRLIVSASAPLVKVGGRVQFGSWLTGPGLGLGIEPVCSWSSSNPAVARIDPSPQFTGIAVVGVSVGSATITAVKDALRASKDILIVADYTGTWTADLRVTQCEVRGGFDSKWCDRQVGVRYAVGLSLDQPGTSAEGRWTMLGGSAVTIGEFDLSGRLHVRVPPDMTGNPVAIDVPAGRIVLKDWDAESLDSSVMTGEITLDWQLPDQSGSAIVRGEIQNATKR